jgi:hypothetical protein
LLWSSQSLSGCGVWLVNPSSASHDGDNLANQSEFFDTLMFFPVSQTRSQRQINKLTSYNVSLLDPPDSTLRGHVEIPPLLDYPAKSLQHQNPAILSFADFGDTYIRSLSDSRFTIVVGSEFISIIKLFRYHLACS